MKHNIDNFSTFHCTSTPDTQIQPPTAHTNLYGVQTHVKEAAPVGEEELLLADTQQRRHQRVHRLKLKKKGKVENVDSASIPESEDFKMFFNYKLSKLTLLI